MEKKLYFGIPGENSDPMFISRYNLSSDISELRVNVGDDYNDKFVVGSIICTGTEFIPMLTVKMNGNVGIGISNPANKLDVDGTVKATSLSITGSITANSLTTGGDLQVGNVAASTNSYGKKLYFGIPGENTDPIFISRFTAGSDMSELRVSVGDNSEDKFVVGYKTASGTEFLPALTVKMGGNVGIGISNPANKLDVNGVIRAKEVKVETGWADFVFNDDYRLKPLSEVNTFIKENKRLPEIPSATEVKEQEGVNLGEMQVKLLQKIEELTLYLIEQNEKIQTLESKITELENK
jgi:hypothetical protein